MYLRFAETVTGASDDDHAALERDLAVLGGREVRHIGESFGAVLLGCGIDESG